MACAVYFWARVAHLIVYTLGLPVFRTLAFTVGFLAQAVLALAIFKEEKAALKAWHANRSHN